MQEYGYDVSPCRLPVSCPHCPIRPTNHTSSLGGYRDKGANTVFAPMRCNPEAVRPYAGWP